MRLLQMLLACVGVCSLMVSPPAATSVQQPATAAPPAEPTPLYSIHEAAAAGDAGSVDLLLAAGFSCDARNALRSTPLHMACVHGFDDVVSMLLEHGASANAANEDGNTPLHAAVGRGHLSCARLLLEHGADAHATSHAGAQPLRTAVHKGDVEMLSAMLDEGGAALSESGVQEAFWVAVQLCEAAAAEGAPLPAAVPRLLHLVFDADHAQLLGREKVATNVTCLQPAEEGAGNNVIDDELASTPLREGRTCEGGCCTDACSRVVFPTFATQEEVAAFRAELEQAIVPPLHQFSLYKCAFRDTRTTLLFIRFVERMRRAIAHEYGLPLGRVLPGQTFVAQFNGAQDKQGGLHSDESTHAEFHYSCVFYLASQGEDFEGGTLHFSDAPGEEGGGGERVLTPLSPQRGAAIIFSSGWENMHVVEPLVSGERIAVPSFFTTQKPEGVTGPPDDPDALWQAFLTPDSAGDVRSFMFHWHELMAPGR